MAKPKRRAAAKSVDRVAPAVAVADPPAPSPVLAPYGVMRVDELRAAKWEGNPRVITPEDFDALKRSLDRFGIVEPVVFNRTTGRVVGGHQRIDAIAALGVVDCPVRFVDLAEADEVALNVALNRTGADWRQDSLAALISSMDETHRALTGFAQPEIDALLRDGHLLKLYADEARDDLKAYLSASAPSGSVEEEEIPEPPKVAITRRGDVWILGEHRLLCGDSTDAADVERVLAGATADLVCTSPPYNCGKDYGIHDDDQPRDDYFAFLRRIMERCVAALGRGRAIAWNIGVSPATEPFSHGTLMRDAGLEFVREIVWLKVGVAFPIWNTTQNRPVARNWHPNYQHELVYIFSKGALAHGDSTQIDEQFSTDVWRIHQSQASSDLPGESNGRRPRTGEHGGFKEAAHPAAYPAGLPLALIRHLTAPGEVVLEPFSGSGTTIVACEQLERSARAIELSPAFVDVSVRRWEKLTGKRATLEGQEGTIDEIGAARGVPA